MEVSTIHVLFGTDAFAIKQKIAKMVETMGEPSTAEINITRLDGRILIMNDLNNAANAIPFLSDRRLVILENPYAFFKGANELKKLATLIGSLPPTTTLVLAEYLDAPANKNKSFNEFIRKLTGFSTSSINLISSELNNPTRGELPNWIIRETKRQAGAYNKNIGMEISAASKLTEMISEDTRQAAQEITKLLEYVNYERNITVQDVEQVSIVSSQQDVFALVDALGNKNGKKAQDILLQLLQTEDPFSLWGMVVRQFRLLLLSRELMDAGGSQDVVMHELHLHPYVAGKLLGQARRFNLNELEMIYHSLLDLDEDVKTGRMPIDLALELFVVELIEK